MSNELNSLELEMKKSAYSTSDSNHTTDHDNLHTILGLRRLMQTQLKEMRMGSEVGLDCGRR